MAEQILEKIRKWSWGVRPPAGANPPLACNQCEPVSDLVSSSALFSFKSQESAEMSHGSSPESLFNKFYKVAWRQAWVKFNCPPAVNPLCTVKVACGVAPVYIETGILLIKTVNAPPARPNPQFTFRVYLELVREIQCMNPQNAPAGGGDPGSEIPESVKCQWEFQEPPCPEPNPPEPNPESNEEVPPIGELGMKDFRAALKDLTKIITRIYKAIET